MFFFAFIAVLALIGVAAWLVRRFATNRLGANTNRGRMPRLAVIDAAAVDGRRRLVLVRRDNIEHLLMIGGPTDIVVEPNIVRAMPAREQVPQARRGAAEPPPRIAPLPDAAWSDGEAGPRADMFDHAEPPMPEPPPRPARPSFADEVRRPAPPPSEPPRRAPQRSVGRLRAGAAGRPARTPCRELRARADAVRGSLAQRADDPRPPRPEPPKSPPRRAPERAAAPPPPPRTPPPPPQSSADQNLAEMAQRLEAACAARPAKPSAPPVAPEPPPAARPPRSEAAAAAAPAPQKSGFENLEDEMASLLGRPKNPS